MNISRRLGWGTFALLIGLTPRPAVGLGAVTPAETGQTASYDASLPRRDDGGVRVGVGWPSPRFTDHGNGTFTDNLTGLLWLKQTNCLQAATWQEQLSQIVALNAGAEFSCTDYTAGTYDDWRLPNLRELESLLNAGANNQVIWLSVQGVAGVVSGTYFSSTSFNAPNVWTLYLPNGWPSMLPRSSSTYAWPVRGKLAPSPVDLPRTGQTVSYDTNLPARDDGALQIGVAWPVPRFVDLGESARDDLTGLEWLIDANCIASSYPAFDADDTAEDGAVTWQHALDFVAGVNAGTYPLCGAGRSDWRLPNRRELYSLIDLNHFNPALPSGHPFAGAGNEEYWSSTTYSVVPSLSCTVDLGYGSWGNRDKVSEPRFVWPVRGGPEIFADGFEFADVAQWSAAVGGP